ncbi:MAG TPA: hypothetical protein VLD62_13040, partial [Acidimicrobiia bacterium]|nr:hypothetical protein [Acidimicrobiia bacterium]
MADLHAVESDAPWPRAGARPVVFLLDAATPVEQRLLKGWIERRRPAGAAYEVVVLPSPRRKRHHRAEEEIALRTALEGSAQALLTPVRVAWFGPGGPKRRTPSLLDLIALGDARAPNRFRQ